MSIILRSTVGRYSILKMFGIIMPQEEVSSVFRTSQVKCVITLKSMFHLVYLFGNKIVCQVRIRSWLRVWLCTTFGTFNLT